MRANAILFAVALFAVVPLASPVGEASHWCARTTVRVSPSFVPAVLPLNFTVSLINNDGNDTTLTSVAVLFDWETTPRSLGGGSLPSGGTLERTVRPSPAPQGRRTVTVTLVGMNDGDPPSEVTTCTATRTVSSVGASEEILAAIMAILLFILGVAIVVVIVILVVAFTWGRKKSPPPTPPPPSSPPSAPPPETPKEPPPTNP
jgi:Na+-transporting methylmalonyl-CoA/oxaloacetate decarboxylase gamma subunit